MLLGLALALSACASDETGLLFCDECHPCQSPDRPFCDLAGVCPGSDGISNTCVPAGCYDAGPADATP